MFLQSCFHTITDPIQFVNKPVSLSINQSINQSINPSINQRSSLLRICIYIYMFINTCACIFVNKSRQLYLHPESMYSETCQDSYPPTADMYNSGESYVRKTKLHKRRNMAKPNKSTYHYVRHKEEHPKRHGRVETGQRREDATKQQRRTTGKRATSGVGEKARG